MILWMRHLLCNLSKQEGPLQLLALWYLQPRIQASKCTSYPSGLRWSQTYSISYQRMYARALWCAELLPIFRCRAWCLIPPVRECKKWMTLCLHSFCSDSLHHTPFESRYCPYSRRAISVLWYGISTSILNLIFSWTGCNIYMVVLYQSGQDPLTKRSQISFQYCLKQTFLSVWKFASRGANATSSFF